MKKFDIEQQRYLPTEFAPWLLKVGKKSHAKNSNMAAVVDKGVCGNGGTTTLLRHTMTDGYLFIISHSQEGVKGKENSDENFQKNGVVFLHSQQVDKSGKINSDSRVYMCTAEGLYDRLESLEALKGDIYFVFDEYHKISHSMDYRPKLARIVHIEKAIKIGLTATPHVGHDYLLRGKVINLPKTEPKLKAYNVVTDGSEAQAIDWALHKIYTGHTVIFASHSISIVMRILGVMEECKGKVYLKVGLKNVALIAFIKKEYPDLLTEKADEADMYLGTSSIVDSIDIRLEQKKVKKFVAILENTFNNKTKEESNHKRNFTDADAYQLPYRLRNIVEQRELWRFQNPTSPYDPDLTLRLLRVARAKGYVKESIKDRSAGVVMDAPHKSHYFTGRMEVFPNKLLEQVYEGEHPVMAKKGKYKFKTLDKDLYDASPKKPPKLELRDGYFPFKKKELGDKFNKQFEVLVEQIKIKNTEEGVKAHHAKKWRRILFCLIYDHFPEKGYGKIDVNIPINLNLEKDGTFNIPSLSKLKDICADLEKKYRAKRKLLLRHLIECYGLSFKDFKKWKASKKVFRGDLKILKLLYKKAKKKKNLTPSEKFAISDVEEGKVTLKADNFKLPESKKELKGFFDGAKKSFTEAVIDIFRGVAEEPKDMLDLALTTLGEILGYFKPSKRQHRYYTGLVQIAKDERESILSALGFEYVSYDIPSSAPMLLKWYFNLPIREGSQYNLPITDAKWHATIALNYDWKYDKKAGCYHHNEREKRIIERGEMSVGKELIDAVLEFKKTAPYGHTIFGLHTHIESRIINLLRKGKGCYSTTVHDEVYYLSTNKDNLPLIDDRRFYITAKEARLKEDNVTKSLNPFTASQKCTCTINGMDIINTVIEEHFGDFKVTPEEKVKEEVKRPKVVIEPETPESRARLDAFWDSIVNGYEERKKKREDPDEKRKQILRDVVGKF